MGRRGCVKTEPNACWRASIPVVEVRPFFARIVEDIDEKAIRSISRDFHVYLLSRSIPMQEEACYNASGSCRLQDCLESPIEKSISARDRSRTIVTDSEGFLLYGERHSSPRTQLNVSWSKQGQVARKCVVPEKPAFRVEIPKVISEGKRVGGGITRACRCGANACPTGARLNYPGRLISF